MEDRLSHAAPGTGGGGSETRPEPAIRKGSGETDVLGILEDIESQFDRLRTIRGDQVEALRELAERSDRLEEKKAELQKLQVELDECRKEWDRKRQREQNTLDETQCCLEADRESHARRVEEDKATLVRDRDALDTDRKRIRRETDTQRRRLDKAQAELDTLQETLDSRSRSVEEAQAAIEEDQARLQEEADEREACHQQLLDALRVARREIGRRGRRLRTLDGVIGALRHNRGQLRSRRRGLESAGRAHRHHIESLEEQVQAQNARLEEAGRRLRTFMEQLREQADLVERGNAALALVDKLEGRIDELQGALAAADNSDETRARVSAMEQELETARLELARVEPAMRELETLRETRPGKDPEVESALEDRTHRLAEIARHLHHRRTRLRNLRKAMRTGAGRDKSNPQEGMAQRLRQSEIVEQRQRELDDVCRMLANSEKKMIRRWAGPRSLVLTSWGLVLIVIIAAASWLSAERVRPALRTASVTLSPRLASGADFDETSSSAWQAFHAAQLESDGFVREVARRSAARRMVPWNSHESVSRLLQNNLVRDTGEPGRLVLTLAANDPERAAAFLDLLANTMAVGSQRTIASRPGGHVSTVLDDRTDGGVLRYARVDPSPLRDDRLVTASVFFGGGLLLTIMVMGLVYVRLIRAKRIFEQAHPVDIEVNTMSARPI